MSNEKFNYLISHISSSSKAIHWTPSVDIAKAKQEVSGFSHFELLKRNPEFIQLAKSILGLSKNNLDSRTLALIKLKEELYELPFLNGHALIEHYIVLCRRFALFNEMDRMAVLLRAHPKSSDLGFEICCVYFYLTQAAVDFTIFGEPIPTKEFLFETSTKKYWLEILTELALDHLRSIMAGLAEEEKIDLYKNWQDLSEQSWRGLWIQRENYFYETLQYLEDFLDIKLDKTYMQELLTTMESPYAKATIHKNLYQLEEMTDQRLTPPIDMSYAQAVKRLKKSLELFYKVGNTIEAIHLGYLKEFNDFVEFETALVNFMGWIKAAYQGERSLQPITFAIAKAYDTYAEQADIAAAFQTLKEEVLDARKFILKDHRANGYLAKWGMFQPSSTLVEIIDKSLSLLELQQMEKKAAPALKKS